MMNIKIGSFLENIICSVGNVRKVALICIAIILLGLLIDNANAFRIFGPASNTDYVTNHEPHEFPPPFIHWDLREFPNCIVPWSLNMPAFPHAGFPGLVANDVRDSVIKCFQLWEDVTPAIIDFDRQVGAIPAGVTGIQLDDYNLFSWDQALRDDVNANDATDVAVSPGANHRLNSIPYNDDEIKACIVDGGNGKANTVKAGDDVQVVAQGITGLYNGQVIILPGPDNILQTAATLDDVASDCITKGSDGIADTPANNVPVFPETLIGLTGLFFNNKTGVIFEVDIQLNDWAGATMGQRWVIKNHDADLAYTLAPALLEVDIQTITTHEIGHLLGIAHTTDIGNHNDANEEIMERTWDLFAPGPAGSGEANHTLKDDDKDACNFLYNPDLGDAPDKDQVYGTKFSTLVHGNVNSRTLNGVQLKNPWPGPVHLFGIKNRQADNYTYEWLGDSLDSECEANVTNLDKYDDGVQFAPNPPQKGQPLGIMVVVNTAKDAATNEHDYTTDKLWINVWIDSDLDEQWEEGGEHIIHENRNKSDTIRHTLPAFPNTDETVWLRARLDWGEDVGVVKKIDPKLQLTEGLAQFGEVEDYPLIHKTVTQYSSTDDPGTIEPGSVTTPNPWTGITTTDPVPTPNTVGAKHWFSKKNLYVPWQQKSLTVELKGNAADKYGVNQAHGYYFKTLIPPVVAEVPVSVVVPPVKDIVGPPKKRIFTILLKPQPQWEVVELVRTGKDKADDTLYVKLTSMCSLIDTLTAGNGPTLDVENAWFGVAGVDSLNITEVYIFPDSALLNFEAPHSFTTANGVWTSEIALIDPFGDAPQPGVKWTVDDIGNGLAAEDSFTAELFMFVAPDTNYTVFAYDEVSGEYQYFKLGLVFETECQGMCGDANGDGQVNVSDAVWVINYVFVGGEGPMPVLACGDANGDGMVNVSDAVWIINYVFVGGDPPEDCSPGSPNWEGDDCCPFMAK
jgi:Dockerin type I domain